MPPSGQDGDQPSAEPPGGGADGRDTSTGDAGDLTGEGDSAAGGNLPGDAGGGADGQGAAGAAGTPGLPGAPGGGDYSLDTLPSGGVFQGSPGAGQPGGAMTAAERAAILDGQLSRTYEVYDEMLRREQADARGAANRAGNSGAGGNEPSGGSGGQGGAQQPGGAMPGGLPNGPGGVDIAGAPGMPSGPPGDGDQQETFPPIPSGRDDDVVARQLREAAMTEPDPELREALWDEYRNYTGIAVDQ